MTYAGQGLARVQEIYQNRSGRVKELKVLGKRIIGYLCCFPPLEMITALDLIPYRVLGNTREPITQADTYLETYLCPFVRSCFDLALKGDYKFLDGWVTPHSCDSVTNTYEIFRHYLKIPYSYFIDVPQMLRPSCHQFFREELVSFKKSLEGAFGDDISEARLFEATRLHNQNRALIRDLYSLRKEDPPLLSGTEMTQIMVADMSLPPAESNELLKEVIREVKGRQEHPRKTRGRLLIWGGPINDVAFIQLIEECGANVVMDDMCIGTRHYWADVEVKSDLLDALAFRYLDRIMCPRTIREASGTHKEHVERKFGYLLDYIKEFGVNGVILQVLRSCDAQAFELPDLRDLLREKGLPVLVVEHDYSLSALAPLRTRVQVFLEMIV